MAPSADDVYVYGAVRDSEVEYGSKIAEGKFAVILKARISVGNKKQDAAAKVLRSLYIICCKIYLY